VDICRNSDAPILLGGRVADDLRVMNPASARSSAWRRLHATITSGAAAALMVGTLVTCGATAQAASPIALGVNTPGINTSTGASLDEFSALVGTMPKIAMWYQDWDEQWSTALLNPRFTSPVTERGATPMVTWEPFLSAEEDSHQPAYALSVIASGRYDRYIWRAARETAAYKKPVFIRLAEEMNGSWSSWGAGVDGNTPQSFIAMWRHVVSIFRLAGASNARWVWSPNVRDTDARAFQQYFPGNAWVDDVGLDGYNFGSSISYWQSFSALFQKSYTELASLTNKPMMIAETASAEQGGSKAEWIESIPRVIASSMPRVRALVWFDRQKEADWRVESSSASLSAFRNTVQSGFFSGGIAPLLEGTG
jgi:beta-mannanase